LKADLNDTGNSINNDFELKNHTNNPINSINQSLTIYLPEFKNFMIF